MIDIHQLDAALIRWCAFLLQLLEFRSAIHPSFHTARGTRSS